MLLLAWGLPTRLSALEAEGPRGPRVHEAEQYIAKYNMRKIGLMGKYSASWDSAPGGLVGPRPRGPSPLACISLCWLISVCCWFLLVSVIFCSDVISDWFLLVSVGFYWFLMVSVGHEYS